MRLLFWLLIFNYCANIYAPDSEESAKPDIEEHSKQEIEESPNPDIEESPKPEIEESLKQDIEESPNPDIEELPKQDIEESSKRDIEESPKPNIEEPSGQDIKKNLTFWEFTNELAKNEDRRESSPFDPLLVISEYTETTETTEHYLPDEVQVKTINQSKGKEFEPSLSTTEKTFELIFLKKDRKEEIEFLCAVDIQHNTEHQRVIEKTTKYYSAFQYCLMKEEFPNNCPSEAIPLVVPMLSKKNELTEIVNCGPNRAYDFLQFAYPYCYSTQRIEEFLGEIGEQDTDSGEDDMKPLFTVDHPMLQLYKICFDTSHTRVVYMHHRIFPSLVKNENRLTNLNYVNMSSKISASSKGEKNAGSPIIPASPQSQLILDQQLYHEKFPKYSNMKKAFANQASAEYRMIPQMLVPAADMPFALWKKSTFSYINIAPLWDQLVPLMDLINDRIRQFAIKRSKKLSIYSAAFDVNFSNYEKLYLDEEKKLPVPTVWAKLVHDEESKTATLILLHNTPGNDFKSSRLCASKQQVTCNFTDWWKTSSQKNIIDEKVIKETARYAYCCQVKKTNIISEHYGIDDIKIRGDIVNIS